MKRNISTITIFSISMVMLTIIFLKGGHKMEIQSNTMESNKSVIFFETENEVISIDLDMSDTTVQLTKELPINVTFNHFNNNEIYTSLPFKLEKKEINISKINKGDVLLFGTNTLVVFYEDYETEYSYTRIGTVAIPKDVELIQELNEIRITK